MKNKNIVFCIT